MAKTSPNETTFAKFTAVQSALAELANTEARAAADNAARDIKLRAELLELNNVMAPLARWRERLDLLAIQKAHCVLKRDYAVLAHQRFEDSLRQYARAESHPDNWFTPPLDNHLTAQHSERMIGFLNRDLAAIDADAAGINSEVTAFERLHGIS